MTPLEKDGVIKQPKNWANLCQLRWQFQLYSLQQATGNLTDQTYTIWSVHLLSYYGKPPPAGELDFLDTAGVPYMIKRTIIKGGVWYRVLVNNSAEYSVAKEYAEMLKKRLGIKKIWLSKKQYTYE